VWVPVWGLEEIASWDILQLIGLAIIVCGLLLAMTPWWARLIVALGMACLSTVLVRRHMDFLPAYLADVVYGRTPPAYFPVVPWLAYALGGTVLGEAYLRARQTRRLSRLAVIVAALGTVLLITGTLGQP